MVTISSILKRFNLLVFCLLGLLNVSLADVQIQADRTQASIDEAFELSIRSNSASSGSFDLSILEQDFEILDQYKQSSVQIINGNMSQQTTWTFTVIAKQAGKITIPPITVGNDKTQPFEITIGDNSSLSGTEEKDILLEVEVEKDAAYVQEQFIYVQRLLFSRPFSNNSTLTRPRLTAGRADVESLGNTPETITQRNGRDYRMITRRFAIIPQESGKLVLAPSVFSGTIGPTNYTRGKRVRVRSEEITLDIKPSPSSFTGNKWIVAKDFSLHLNWPVPPDQIKAGEPITLVLAAIADGLRAEQIPELNLQARAGIKLYPEKPNFQNVPNREGIVGTMNRNIVLIASGGDEIELPGLKVPWWNSQTNQQEIATLAPTKLRISGAPAKPETSQQKQQPAGNNQPETPKNTLLGGNNVSTSKLSNTVWLLIILAALLSVGLLVRWYTKDNCILDPAETAKDRKKSKREHQQQILINLKTAALNNNKERTQQVLQQWAESLGLIPATLANLEQLNVPALNKQLKQLNKALYSKEELNWKGRDLWQEIEQYQQSFDDAEMKQSAKNKEYIVLEPMYHS